MQILRLQNLRTVLHLVAKPQHLGERWNDISYEKAKKDWREIYKPARLKDMELMKEIRMQISKDSFFEWSNKIKDLISSKV